MARKGLPKKYAKMGFKKGWKAYRKSMKPKTRKRASVTKPTRKGGRTMKSRARDVFFGLKDSEIIGSVGYAVTEPFFDQFTSGLNVPVIGTMGDDIVKLLVGLAGRKYVKQPMVKGVFNSMAVVNLYKVAQKYTPNLFGGTTTTASSDGW